MTELSRTKKAVFALTAMLVAFVVGIFVLEIGLRIVMPRREVAQWFIRSDRYGYFQRRNFKQTYRYMKSDATWVARLNNLGLRGPDYPGPQPGEKRVLLMGDSFTFGYGLNEDLIFPTKLQDLLSASDQKWRVINAGVGGWGTLQEVLFARDHFDAFQPDVIVLTYCDNDINDDILFSEGKAKGLIADFPGKQFLRDHSYTYGLLYRLFADRLFASALKDAHADPGHPLAQKLPEERAKYLPNLKLWKRTIDALNDFFAEFQARRPGGVVIVQQAQPYRTDIMGQLEHVVASPNRILLDLTSVPGMPPADQVLLPYDPHWTPAVHDLVAHKLAEVILNAERQ